MLFDSSCFFDPSAAATDVSAFVSFVSSVLSFFSVVILSEIWFLERWQLRKPFTVAEVAQRASASPSTLPKGVAALAMPKADDQKNKKG